MKKDIYFSASRYSLMNDCLAKYKFHYIDKVKVETVTWPGTIFGTSVHRMIELFLFLYKRNKSTFQKDIEKIKQNKKAKKLEDLISKIFIHIYEKELSKYDPRKKKSKFKHITTKFRKTRDYNINKTISNGTKWCNKIIIFLIKYINIDKTKSEVKLQFSVKKGNYNIMLTGYIDLLLENNNKSMSIIDVKNTKYPEKYFCVDWENDIQSLTYLYLTQKNLKQFINSFSYFIFNINENMIFINNQTYSENKIKEDIKNFNKKLNDFIKNHEKALKDKKDIYFPEKNKCYWCEFSSGCKQSY